MNPWIAKALVLTSTVVLMAIRAPHGHRSRIVKVATSYKTPLETGLLVLAWVGFFVPLIWVASPAFWFAEYGELFAKTSRRWLALKLLERSALDWPELAALWFGEHRLRILQQLTRYFEHRMNSGRLRAAPHPAAAARL